MNAFYPEKAEKLLQRTWFQLLFFPVASLVIFYPVIHNSFLSDDFRVMKRVGIDKIIFIKDFFRPLSDITLYLNYLAGGFNPAGYYLANIILHGLNAFLLLKFVGNWKWTPDPARQRMSGWLAGLIFLIYPFHNESIVWILGRASLVANFFGIIALLALVSKLPGNKKIAAVCACYFIGLTSYESIILLPLMVLVILFRHRLKAVVYFRWIAALGLTLLTHLIIRVMVSGGVLGSYGKGFFSWQLVNYLGTIPKVAARLFLPPIQDTLVFTILMLILLGILFWLVRTFFLQFREQRDMIFYGLKIVLLISIACVIPVLFGVSTHSSESDRFLYFPSFFIAAAISFLMLNLLKQRKVRLMVLFVLSLYFLSNLEKNNRNWVRASSVARDIVGRIGSQDPKKIKIIINLPDEWNGAYIFREGLEDAVSMNGGDPGKIVVLNHLTGPEISRIKGSHSDTESIRKILFDSAR